MQKKLLDKRNYRERLFCQMEKKLNLGTDKVMEKEGRGKCDDKTNKSVYVCGVFWGGGELKKYNG